MANSMRLEGDLTIYRAAELKQVLLEAVDKTGPLEVDLSGVTELDTAGVQLLLLAKGAATARNKQIRLVNHSPAAVEVFELLHLRLEDLQ
jgi:anti-sigma B factor antagonist